MAWALYAAVPMREAGAPSRICLYQGSLHVIFWGVNIFDLLIATSPNLLTYP